jgi:hypothetical protein
MSETPVTAENFKVTGATPQDLASLEAALTYLQNNSPTALATLLEAVANGTVTININHAGDDSFQAGSSFGTGTINWDPNAGLIVLNNQGGFELR